MDHRQVEHGRVAGLTTDDAPEAALSAPSQAAETESTGRAEGDRRLIFLRIIKALLALALLPVVLMVLYILPFIHPPSTLMLADLVLLRGYDRQWVPLEQISPNLIRAVMMSEDGQFCSHDGVDWVQMRSVIDDALDGEETRGASTITMQTVKNLFLWNSRSFIRKGMEIPLALIADKVWSKRRTMELYLNIAEWGPGIYGVEAASRYHFKIPAAKLSARQAALLAVSLPNPIDRNASKPGPGLRRLAAMVERRARGADPYISCVDR